MKTISMPLEEYQQDQEDESNRSHRAGFALAVHLLDEILSKRPGNPIPDYPFEDETSVLDLNYKKLFEKVAELHRQFYSEKEPG
jgi:hypothetical protein